MQYTEHYNLKLPEGTDTASVEDLNYNAEVLDEILTELSQEGIAPVGSIRITADTAYHAKDRRYIPCDGSRVMTEDYPELLDAAKPSVVSEFQMTFPSSPGAGARFAYGGGTWVVFSSQCRCYSVDEGTTWVALTGFVGGYAQGPCYGNDIFVCGGYRSINGATWVSMITPVPSLSSYVAYGNGKFIACGNGGVYTSENGDVWTKISDLEAFRFAYGDGKWIATGEKSYYSVDDGETWIEMSGVPDADNTNINAYTALCYGGGVFVCCFGGNLYYSLDGEVWNVTTTNAPASITWGGDMFLGLGQNGNLINSVFSEDGINWLNLTAPNVGLQYYSFTPAYYDGSFTIMSNLPKCSWRKFTTLPALTGITDGYAYIKTTMIDDEEETE